MLQRGLFTIAEKQQQPQPPYDTTRAATARGAKEQEQLNSKSSSSRQDLRQENKERINCLPIIELPQIKIEQDVEYMEEEHEVEQELQQEAREQERQDMEVDQEELSIKPVPQLLEPTSILKTSLLTGAANTLATLTAAAEQIARMPNESLAKNYPYLREENKRTYTIEEHHEKPELAEDKKMGTVTTTTYTSILQTALMSKRPATLNVAATSTTQATFTTCSLASTKALHVRTPDQVLKTAVTLATLGEIAAQQEQHQQQLQQQQQQQQQPHILVVPQVQRKMCTLPFKKLNFANVTTSSSSLLSSTTSSNTTTTAVAATAAAAATTNTITNNYLGSNLKTNTNLTNSSCIINTNNLAASTSNNRDKLETNTTTFFDTNNIIDNVTICSNNNNSNNNNNNSNFKSQTMATQTLKIPTIKPHLVTTQTQTEEISTQTQATHNATPSTAAMTLTNNSASSLQTANNSGLLRTAVSTNTKMLTQNSSLNSLSNKFLSKSKLEAEENVTSFNAAAPTNVADNVVGNIFKHVSSNSTTLAKMNVIQNKAAVKTNSPASVSADNASSSSANTATNVTVVVFETLLPED